MIEVIKNIWEAIPGALKRFVGYGIASGIALAMVLALYLFWGTGYLQERLGLVVATKADLKEQTETLADGSADMVYAAMGDVLEQYDSTLHRYLAQEREMAKDTILIPIIKSIQSLDANLRRLATAQNQMSGRMSELPSVMDDKMVALLRSMPPSVTPEQIRELSDLVRQQQAEIELMREEIKSGRKTTKQKF